MKTMTIGNGYIASYLPYDMIPDRVPVEQHLIEGLLDTYKPDVLINCIGRCGTPNIDWCEKNQSETLTANTTVPTALATACEGYGIRFIHIGSGCIYCGKSPHHEHIPSFGLLGAHMQDTGWTEEDDANPRSYYSKTKYATDLAIGSLPNTTVLRIRMPVGSKSHPRNFIDKVLNYEKIINEPNSMTFLDDLVRCVEWVIDTDRRGIWHVANPGTLSVLDVIMEYRKYRDHNFSVISTDELDTMTAAKRSNCILDTSKLSNAGFKMRPAKEALAETMAKYCKGIT